MKTKYIWGNLSFPRRIQFKALLGNHNEENSWARLIYVNTDVPCHNLRNRSYNYTHIIFWRHKAGIFRNRDPPSTGVYLAMKTFPYQSVLRYMLKENPTEFKTVPSDSKICTGPNKHFQTSSWYKTSIKQPLLPLFWTEAFNEITTKHFHIFKSDLFQNIINCFMYKWTFFSNQT